MRHLACWILIALVFAANDHTAHAAEQHRATNLGNPATRFAPPLTSPDDLRTRFRDLTLLPDIASILRQWGWQGRFADLLDAAAIAPVSEWEIPVGSTMPFMSSRRNGRPICLRNVLWAGREPAPAYAFEFSSLGRRYRCITPKACSNFFLVELPPTPRRELALACTIPAEVLVGAAFDACFTVRNFGEVTEPEVVVRLPLPPGARAAVEGTEAESGQQLVWRLAALAPGESRQVCAAVRLSTAGQFQFNASLFDAGTGTAVTTTSCELLATGRPAVLLEVVDLEDPIEVGGEEIYEIVVTNQGSAPATNLRITCWIESTQEYLRTLGPTAGHLQDDVVVFAPLAELAPKDQAVWLVAVRAHTPGDVRFTVELTSDQLTRPVRETEATTQY